jgi:hypothetical protein
MMSSEKELIRSAVAGDKVALQSLLLIHYSEIEASKPQSGRISAGALPPKSRPRI